MRNRRLSITSRVEFTTFGIEKMNVRQPSLVDEFYIQAGKCCETGEVTHSHIHPLYMLFNQERLNRLGDGAVQSWLKQLDAAGNTAYSEVKKKISDDDLLSLVKSRHIQQPSELESWLNHLNERADVFNSEVQKLIQKQQEEQQDLAPTEEEMNKLSKSE